MIIFVEVASWDRVLDFETLAGENRIVTFVKGKMDQKILYMCASTSCGVTVVSVRKLGAGH